MVIMVLRQRFFDCDNVRWMNRCALVKQLIKGMLTIGTCLSPHNGSGFVINRLAIPPRGLPIGLHISLLQICRKTIQILGIRENHLRRETEVISRPNSCQRRNQWQIIFVRSLLEVKVHRPSSLQQRTKVG